MLRKIMLAAFVVAFAGGAALAQETCESKAVGKDGKPLAGAAKASSIKKCMADTCATKAVSQDGKPLSGAAKTSFMKKCEKGAARVCDSNCTGEEPANSQFGGSKSMIGMDPLRKLDSKSLAMHPDGTFRTSQSDLSRQCAQKMG